MGTFLSRRISGAPAGQECSRRRLEKLLSTRASRCTTHKAIRTWGILRGGVINFGVYPDRVREVVGDGEDPQEIYCEVSAGGLLCPCDVAPNVVAVSPVFPSMGQIFCGYIIGSAVIELPSGDYGR